jgi:hypothetical protein
VAEAQPGLERLFLIEQELNELLQELAQLQQSKANEKVDEQARIATQKDSGESS